MTQRTPLALLPGLLCDGALWTAQVQDLEGIADPWVADFVSQTSITAMAQDVLAAMPGRFALAGLSMGGYVAFEVMRQAPERVTRLALIATSPWPDGPEHVQRRHEFMRLAQTGRFKGVTKRMLPELIHEGRLDDTHLAGAVMAMAERVGKDAFLRQQRAIMARVDSRPLLPGIEVPTLVLCGRQDALTPLRRHEEMHREIPAAELVVLEDCGHLPPMERPREVNAALRAWLARD